MHNNCLWIIILLLNTTFLSLKCMKIAMHAFLLNILQILLTVPVILNVLSRYQIPLLYTFFVFLYKNKSWICMLLGVNIRRQGKKIFWECIFL
jgi:hypothetical protein